MGAGNTFLRMLLGGVQGFGSTYADQMKQEQKAAIDKAKLETAAQLTQEKAEKDRNAQYQRALDMERFKYLSENGLLPESFGADLGDQAFDPSKFHNALWAIPTQMQRRPVFGGPAPAAPAAPKNIIKLD